MKQVFKPDVLRSVLDGKSKVNGAPFTMVSLVTGKDFTYKLNRSNYQGKWFTHAMVEVQSQQYKYMGFYTNGVIIYKKVVSETPAAKALARVLKRVEDNKDLSQVEFLHTGRCIKCGRELTDAKSIELGIGPVCITKFN